ncbi:hypothetical protein NMY22_g10825 [Coprinellus aureogranulatus]|nr:hypothetical protein NMY22_g10825 [Coprinellus aureogranulatus]
MLTMVLFGFSRTFAMIWGTKHKPFLLSVSAMVTCNWSLLVCAKRVERRNKGWNAHKFPTFCFSALPSSLPTTITIGSTYLRPSSPICSTCIMPRNSSPSVRSSDKENVSPVKAVTSESSKVAFAEAGYNKAVTVYDADPALKVPPAVSLISPNSRFRAGDLTLSVKEYLQGSRYTARIARLEYTGACVERKDVWRNGAKPRIVECVQCGAVVDLGPISLGMKAYLEHADMRHGSAKACDTEEVNTDGEQDDGADDDEESDEEGGSEEAEEDDEEERNDEEDEEVTEEEDSSEVGCSGDEEESLEEED